VETGWHKTQGAETRRGLALKAHKGDRLSTARGLIALHNVTTDPETKRLAGSDAKYFFAEHRKTGK
jgi:uncharacterized membrane protein